MSKAISLPLIGGFAKNQNTSQVRAPKINGRVTWVSHAPSKSMAKSLTHIYLSVSKLRVQHRVNVPHTHFEYL
jgi:hypothetical protein